MKKLVQSVALLMIFSLWANAQTIENFESINMNIFASGANGVISVVANPDQNGNSSLYVGKMVRGFDGDPWAGWWSELETQIDVTANRYVHIKVWKPRISPVVFKYEGAVNSGDVFPINAQALTNEWEELVFDMSVVSGNYNKIVLIPDFETPVGLTEDIVIYYDDLYVNDDPAVGSAPVQIIENFETIPLNYMINGDDDDSYMELVPNPDKSGINISNYVIHFFRDKDGFPWDGFWSNLPTAIDVTNNKYVHVKVWKPRISPVKFKIEGGAAGTIEVESMYPQTKINQWEDMVFDFTSKTGTYPIIAFLPDFESPVTLTEDIDIYFDDIILNNNPNPLTELTVTFNVNMTDADPFNPETDDVFISGDFAGWAQPGSNADYKMTPTADPMIYTLTINLAETGTIQYKYFRVINNVASWDNGEWGGDPNRKVIITATTTLNDTWADKPVNVTFNVDMTDADPFNPDTDDVYIAGSLANGWAQPGTIPQYKMTPVSAKSMIYTITLLLYPGDYQYKYFRVIDDVPSWDNGEWNGDPNRLVTVEDVMTVDNIWGTVGINEYPAVTFRFYPNPVNEKLTVDNLERASKIEILSITGEKVSTIENISSNSVIINTANLSKGVYMLVVYHNNEVQTTKFIK